MKNHAYSLIAPAPVEVREAKVFKLHATRHNLAPEATEKVTKTFEQALDLVISRKMDNPIKPANHYEVVGRATKELFDYTNAVYSNDPREAQRQLFDLFVSIGELASFSDHLIKID